MYRPYIGQIELLPFTFAPQNWALCEGQLLQISENEALYSLIGTTFGGDGQTTFALPDQDNVARQTVDRASHLPSQCDTANNHVHARQWLNAPTNPRMACAPRSHTQSQAHYTMCASRVYFHRR